MKKHIFYFLLTVLLCTGAGFSAYAAFPVAENAAPAIEQTTSAPLGEQHFRQYSTPAPKATKTTKTTAYTVESIIFGIAALAAGIIAVAIVGGNPIAGILFAAGAVILGVLGLNRPLRALAIGGIALGIVAAILALADGLD